MKTTKLQKVLLTVIIMSAMFHIFQYFSPQWLVDWAWHGDSDIISVMFNRATVYHLLFLDNINISPYIPLVVYAVSIAMILTVTEDNYQKLKVRVNNNNGFTLVELMIVIAILGILSSIAIPVLNASNYRLRADVADFRSTMRLARMEAIKRNTDVYMGVNGNTWKLVTVSRESEYTTVSGKGKYTASKIITLGTHTVHPSSSIASVDIGADTLTPTVKLLTKAYTDINDFIADTADLNNQKITMAFEHVTVFNSRGFITSGDGTYTISNNTRKIPIVVSLSGLAKVGQIENI